MQELFITNPLYYTIYELIIIPFYISILKSMVPKVKFWMFTIVTCVACIPCILSAVPLLVAILVFRHDVDSEDADWKTGLWPVILVPVFAWLLCK